MKKRQRKIEELNSSLEGVPNPDAAHISAVQHLCLSTTLYTFRVRLVGWGGNVWTGRFGLKNIKI
jgi:hypothetical protein